MYNIKQVIVSLILMAAHAHAMQVPHEFQRHTKENLSAFKDHLVAFKLAGIVEGSQAYKIRPEESVGFGMVTHEGGDLYLVRMLINKDTSGFITNAFRLLSSNESIEIRNATVHEKELVKQAIKHSGARFWSRKTDADSLQLLESLATEHFVSKLTLVKTFQEAQQFADRFVVYRPRQTLGERVALPEENVQLNYGYVDPGILHHPDGAAEPKGDPFLKLFALCHFQSHIITRAISDKTLAEEALSLRLADPKECQRIKEILIDNAYFLQYISPTSFKESYCGLHRLSLKSVQSGYKTIKTVLDNQSKLSQNIHNNCGNKGE